MALWYFRFIVSMRSCSASSSLAWKPLASMSSKRACISVEASSVTDACIERWVSARVALSTSMPSRFSVSTHRSSSSSESPFFDSSSVSAASFAMSAIAWRASFSSILGSSKSSSSSVLRRDTTM